MHLTLRNKIFIYLLALVSFLAILLIPSVASAATIAVETSADNTTVDGDCTLREAIGNSNADAATHADCVAGSGQDTISFAIPGAGPHVITVTGSSMTTVSDDVIIDGETQSGASCGTLVPSLPAASNTPHTIMIEIDASGLATGNGLVLGASSSGSTIRGLAIGGATDGATEGYGLASLGSDDHVIECNHIGTDALGTTANQNTATGIHLTLGTDDSIVRNNLLSGNDNGGILVSFSSTGNLIEDNIIGLEPDGVTDEGNSGNGVGFTASSTLNTVRGNLISRNSFSGVTISSISGSSDTNTVQGNFIGTDITGTLDRGNVLGSGISLNTDSNIIGGAGAGEGNLISGNGFSASSNAVSLGGDSNSFQGNIVGLQTDGTTARANSGRGINISGNSNTIGGTATGARNIIASNTSHGIRITGDSNTVLNNYIGTDVTGTIDRGNSLNGIYIDGGSSNTIGGSTATARNIISGNTTNGVEMGPGSADNTISGNYIGTDATGTVAIANTLDGIRHASLGPNTIGGATSARRNIISGNGDDGVQLDSGGPSGNALIQNNWIGVTSDGTSLGNGTVFVGSGIEIGWQDTGENEIIDNVISANSSAGINTFALLSTGDTIQGNYIGTNTAGEIETGFGNVESGITIAFGAVHMIGGTGTDDGNVIAGNLGGGVILIGNQSNIEDFTGIAGYPGAPTPNYSAEAVIIGNSIYGNTEGLVLGGLLLNGLGINLTDWDGSGTGVNDNDDLDVDGGANDFLNFIDATSATNEDGTQTVYYDLDVPAGDYRIEFFANDEEDPSGYGEGQDLLFADTVSHDGSGTIAFSSTFSNPDTSRLLSTTVTTDLGGGDFGVTSEYSNVYPAIFPVPEEPTDLADTGINENTVYLIVFTLFAQGFVYAVYSRRKIFELNSK